MRFVKNRRDLKIGTKNDVTGANQAHFARSTFFFKRGYEIRHWAFLPKGVMRFVKNKQNAKIDTINIR